MDTFKLAQHRCSVKKAPFKRVMTRSGDLVAEGTVGAIEFGPDADQWIRPIADTHVAFLRAIAGN